MTWQWSFPTPAPTDLQAEAETGWAERQAAESWLQDVFDDLLEADIHQVTLTCDGSLAYTMSLDD